MQEIESEWRLSEDVTNEDLFDLYMAKKKSGKPKDDYPSEYLPTSASLLSCVLNTSSLNSFQIFPSQIFADIIAFNLTSQTNNSSRS